MWRILISFLVNPPYYCVVPISKETFRLKRRDNVSHIDIFVSDIRNEIHENNLFKENEDVLFVNGNYAVLERFTGKSYSYRLVNIFDMKSKYLCSRKTKVIKEAYNILVRKALQFNSGNAGNCNFGNTKHERVEKLLSRIFLLILPQHGLSLRENQHELALQILKGLIDKSISLMEAEVGIGKTHAYIIAAVVYGLFSETRSPVIISTSTIALQKSITEEYIPQISQILLEHKIIQKPLTFVVRKGKSHYVCDKRLKKYWSTVESNIIPQKEMESLKQLLVANHNNIDLDVYSLTRYIKDKICVNDKCNDACNHYEICRFMRFNHNCIYDKYDFQIANHNYVMANIIAQKENRKQLLPNYTIVIFDEAHKLYDVAKQMYGCFLSDTDITHLIDYITMSKLSELKSKAMQIICDRLEKCNNKIFGELLQNSPLHLEEDNNGRSKAEFTHICLYYMKELLEALADLREYIYSCSDKRLKVRGKNILRICREVTEKLNIFTSPENMICWIESQKSCFKLCAIPKDLNKILANDLWSARIPYILTSGTISVNGNFDLLKNKTGIELISKRRIRETSKKSMFDYKSNALIYIPEHIPFPNLQDGKYIKAITNEIHKLIKGTHGHTLILFTSYWLMDRVFYEVSQNVYDYPLFVMGRGRIDALNNFKISGNGVLFASDTAGEGIDIAGDTLSNLIIVKLPFAVPDPIAEYEQSVMGGLKAYLDKIIIPNMIIKLKQYAGRLIRSETDTGIVAILDSRVNSRGKYRNIVLSSLFDAPVSNRIADVEEFILAKKDERYFE